MVEPKMIVGGAAAFALVGAAFWGATFLMPATPSQADAGTVEISMEDKAWMVEVHDLAPSSSTENLNRTAAAR
jgi:hypothetical protein